MMYTKPKAVSHTQTQTQTQNCNSCTVEEPLEVLLVTAVGLAVAFCWIPHVGEKRRINSFFEFQ